MSGQGISPMRQKIKAITDLAPTTNVTEVRHVIGLIGYYRKFFPVFSDMTIPLKLRKCSIQMDRAMPGNLDYIKQVITTNPILVYSDPDKQYYLSMDSSKHCWNGIFVQYTEQAREDGTKFKVPPPYHLPK